MEICYFKKAKEREERKGRLWEGKFWQRCRKGNFYFISSMLVLRGVDNLSY